MDRVVQSGSLRPLYRVRRVGAGVAGFQNGVEVFTQKMGLGSHAEVYDGELAALAMGAATAVKYCSTHPEITHIHFFADNTSAVGAAFDTSSKPGQSFCIIFNKRIRELLEDGERSVEVAWAPGHAGIQGNERADELAKEAVGLEAKIAGSRANALRRSKDKLKRDWTRTWKNSPKTGFFAPSNGIAPSLKPTKHFRELHGKREVFGRLVQCRTGHCFSGEYYSRFVPQEAIQCLCGEPTQSREHIIRDCSRYNGHREGLCKVSRDIYLPDILGTTEGIGALASFLEKSGAFTKSGNPKRPPIRPSLDEEELALEDWLGDLDLELEEDPGG